MKVCFIAPQVMNVVSGGLSTQVTLLTETLQKKGVSVIPFNPWETYDWSTIDCAHIFRADLETYPIAQWLYESKIPFAVTPVFYNTHHPLFIRSSRPITGLLKKLHTGIRTDLDCVHDICHFSTIVLVNTCAEKTFLEQGLGIDPSKIAITPNAVETRFAEADPSLFITTYDKKEFILSVANFGYKRKNMLNLIRALETIDHQAVLIGTIYDNAYGRECRLRMEKSKNILWLDAIPHNDPLLASAYAACKVFALPSYFETPGLSTMEAAVAGAAIVTTPRGGTKEYFGDMVAYADPSDITSIRKAILQAFDKPADPALKKHILTNYTYSVVAETLVNMYGKIRRK